MNRLFRHLSLIALASYLSASCESWCRGMGGVTPGSCKKFEEDREDEMPEQFVGDSAIQPNAGSTTAPVVPTTDVVQEIPSAGAALTRLAPEQYSNNIQSLLNFGAPEIRIAAEDNDSGQVIDYLVLGYGVPLGGIDFRAATRRDPTTKAQTLLVVRLLAWDLAQAVVWKDHGLSAANRKVFTQGDFTQDRPDQGGESALRWYLTLDELFYRFYARPPRDSEKEAVKNAFMQAYNAEQYPPKAWVVVLYALLSSQEFWHI